MANYSNVSEVNVSGSNLNFVYDSYGLPEDLISVRFSKRAKRLLFRSSVARGVEIVIPQGTHVSRIKDGVVRNLSWINAEYIKIVGIRANLNPDEISLKALDEIWLVRYTRLDKIPNGFKSTGRRIITVGLDPNDIFFSVRNLQQWFHQKSKDTLIPWLKSLADKRQLQFARITVRNQVSRWGSCSERGNISLNRNLLFLSSHLVEYVLHHELTHLSHMNHSRNFWSSFEEVLPNYHDLRQELKSFDPEHIPVWASYKP